MCSRNCREAGYAFESEWFAPHFEFRFPVIGSISNSGIHLELRHALEPWNVLGEEASGGGTVRNVDSSVERLQVKVSGLTDPRFVILCNGRRVPLRPTGVRANLSRASGTAHGSLLRAFIPTIPVHTPLVFDMVDTWSGSALGAASTMSLIPGDAQTKIFRSMRMKRKAAAGAFQRHDHTPGTIDCRHEESNPDFPMTLDLRWPRADFANDIRRNPVVRCSADYRSADRTFTTNVADGVAPSPALGPFIGSLWTTRTRGTGAPLESAPSSASARTASPTTSTATRRA